MKTQKCLFTNPDIPVAAVRQQDRGRVSFTGCRCTFKFDPARGHKNESSYNIRLLGYCDARTLLTDGYLYQVCYHGDRVCRHGVAVLSCWKLRQRLKKKKRENPFQIISTWGWLLNDFLKCRNSTAFLTDSVKHKRKTFQKPEKGPSRTLFLVSWTRQHRVAVTVNSVLLCLTLLIHETLTFTWTGAINGGLHSN